MSTHRTRLERKQSFENFFDKAKTIFETFRQQDSSAQKFQDIYMLCVCPGSRNGGLNKNVVEVFWGQSIFDQKEDFDTTTGRRGSKNLVEYGVTLDFYYNDPGYVSIRLYPAHTEQCRQREDIIILYSWIDPIKLSKRYFLKRLWKDFMAYMQYTSLDGVPTWTQRLRINYLRFVRHLVVQKRWQPTQLSVYLKEILKYVFTVGLSGGLLRVIDYFSEK